MILKTCRNAARFFIPFLLQQCLTGPINVACADCENNITGIGGPSQCLFNFLKGIYVHTVGDFLGHIAAGNSNSIFLTGRINVRQNANIGATQLFNEIIKECVRAGIGMGLENNDCALITKRLNSIHEAFELTGMMGIVIVYISTVELALEFKAPACTCECRKAILDSKRTCTETNGGSSGCKGILYRVHTGNTQGNMGEFASLIDNIKVGLCTQKNNILGINIGFGSKAKGNELG